MIHPSKMRRQQFLNLDEIHRAVLAEANNQHLEIIINWLHSKREEAIFHLMSAMGEQIVTTKGRISMANEILEDLHYWSTHLPSTEKKHEFSSNTA